MKNHEHSPVDVFRNEIERYERHLWGLRLYHWTSPTLYRWLQKGSFRRITARVETALTNARGLLRQVETGSREERDLSLFDWPGILPAMEQRTETLAALYVIVFRGRPKQSLSAQEIRRLRAALIREL